MRLMAKNFKGHYKEIVLGPLFKLFEAILELFVPLVMANIIDVGIKNGDAGYVVRGGLLMLGLALAGATFGLTCQYYAAVAAGHFGRGLRAQVYEHIMKFSAGETARFGAGGLITRLTNDSNAVQGGVNMMIRLGTRVPFLLIGSIVMAMVINPQIGFIFLIATPIIGLVLFLIMKRTLPGYATIQAGQDKLSNLSAENLEGVRVIRAFSRQKQEKEEFGVAGDRVTNLMVGVGKFSAALGPLTTVIANLAIVAIVWFGAGFAFEGRIATGEIVALVNYMIQVLLALVVATNLVVFFTRGIASGKRVAAVLETQPSILDGPGAAERPAAPAIELRNVSFAYHKAAAGALEEISLRIPKGQTVGIIGGTGSGKSTLVNLIIRNFDADMGAVLVNGEDVEAYNLHSLRSKIGIVPQNATLFTGSVAYNLRISAPQADDAALWRALTLAQAGFVKDMAGGLNAELTEGAANLSGGQRQRLTIARALVREPEILILDDASSALDYATDAALRSALHAEAQRRADKNPLTLLMISQRATAIKNADQILVLDDGMLAGMGTHEELLQENEIYREICLSQGLFSGEAG